MEDNIGWCHSRLYLGRPAPLCTFLRVGSLVSCCTHPAQVMSTLPSMVSTPLSQRILSIFKPFSTQLWMTILGLVLLSTLLIYIFEVCILRAVHATGVDMK